MSEAAATTVPAGGMVLQAFERASVVFADALVKAVGGKPSPDPEELREQAGPVFAEARSQAMSLVVDPYAWQQGPEFMARPNLLGWGTLRRLARQPLVAAIIQTRVNQVAQFCRPQENRYQPGFRIRMRGTRRAPRGSELTMIERLEQWLVQCGTIQDTRQLQHRPGFVAFTKAVIRDSLSYDQACAEIVPTKASRLGGLPRPGRIQWVDAATIRISHAALDGHGLPEDDYDTPRYIQVYEDTAITEYQGWRMMFGIRNPDTSIYQHGYGLSELELMVRIITAWLNAFDRNFRYFTQGFNARGILNLKGVKATEAQLRGFKRELQLMAMGVLGSHRVPVTQAEGMEFITLGNETQDMQWSQWSDLLVKLLCSLYLMDPAEVNFNFGNTGQSSAMGVASVAEKIEESRARGLIPLAHDYYDWINRWVIWPLDPDFEASPTGTKRSSEKDDLELDQIRTKFLMTVNETRARNDLPPLDGKLGEIILDSTYLQHTQAAAQDETDTEHAPPLDTGDLFGADAAQPSADAASDTGTEAPDVIPDQQPLAASLRGRYPRARTLIEL